MFDHPTKDLLLYHTAPCRQAARFKPSGNGSAGSQTAAHDSSKDTGSEDLPKARAVPQTPLQRPTWSTRFEARPAESGASKDRSLFPSRSQNGAQHRRGLFATRALRDKANDAEATAGRPGIARRGSDVPPAARPADSSSADLSPGQLAPPVFGAQQGAALMRVQPNSTTPRISEQIGRKRASSAMLPPRAPPTIRAGAGATMGPPADRSAPSLPQPPSSARVTSLPPLSAFVPSHRVAERPPAPAVSEAGSGAGAAMHAATAPQPADSPLAPSHSDTGALAHQQRVLHNFATALERKPDRREDLAVLNEQLQQVWHALRRPVSAVWPYRGRRSTRKPSGHVARASALR